VSTRCIGDVAELLRGVTYGKSDTTDSTDPDALPLLRATNITELGLLLADLVFIPARLARPEQRVRKGDIVMTMSSGSASVVGRSILVDDPIDATFGAFCGVLRSSDQVLGQYLSYMICAPHIRQYWTDRARGTNINNLKREDVLQTEILVPPLAEQRRIVARLDEMLSVCMEVSTNIERRKVKAGELRQSVLAAAFRGEL
jgi:type I restriction enzyme S subunit